MAQLAVPALAIGICAAAVVDRIAVVVGKAVITQSQVMQEVRLTEFLNRQPLDLSPAARRAAAERLIDQQLIRDEMGAGQFPAPTEDEAWDMMRNFRQENYPDDAQFRDTLRKYGLTEDDVKQHLLWQLAALRFTDLRFPAGPITAPTQSANRMRAGATESDEVDEKLGQWLKETRTGTRIRFQPEAFR
jgi:hypothetical protein